LLCFTFAGDGDGLAGESADNNVNWSCGVEVMDIAPSWHRRPMLGQHLAAEGVNLDLSDARHSSAFKAEVESPDAGKQRQECHALPCSAGHRAPPRTDRRASAHNAPIMRTRAVERK
jgi:hypothetical protein